MDPFSDEILGVKLQVAALMEKAHSPLKAIEVLSLIHADCLRWLEKLGDKPGNEGKRTRVLEKCVRMSVRIGELYSSDAVGDTEAAEGHLVWAVTVLLKESKRREMEGVKEGEGPWMNNEEIGGALECETLTPSPNPAQHKHIQPTHPSPPILGRCTSDRHLLSARNPLPRKRKILPRRPTLPTSHQPNTTYKLPLRHPK